MAEEPGFELNQFISTRLVIEPDFAFLKKSESEVL